MEERVSEARLALSSLFFGGLWAAPAAQLRSKKRTKTRKQATFHNEWTKQIELEWIDGKKKSLICEWNQSWIQFGFVNGAPSGSAASPSALSSFCSPAARGKKEEKSWMGRAWPEAHIASLISSMKRGAQLIHQLSISSSAAPSTLPFFQKEKNWLDWRRNGVDWMIL